MKEKIIAILQNEEPEYARAKEFGKEAIPVLTEIINGSDPFLAAKAVYFASYINIPESLHAMQAAMNNKDADVRKAVAGSLQFNTKVEKEPLLRSLMNDKQADVQLVSLKMTNKLNLTKLMPEVREKLKQEKNPMVRDYISANFKQ